MQTSDGLVVLLGAGVVLSKMVLSKMQKERAVKKTKQTHDDI